MANATMTNEINDHGTLSIVVGNVQDVSWPHDDDGDEVRESDWSYYVTVGVTVHGRDVTVGCVVGCPPASVGSADASGAGVRPYCSAWWSDSSDHAVMDDSETADAVLAAIEGESYRLYCEADERAGGRE